MRRWSSLALAVALVVPAPQASAAFLTLSPDQVSRALTVGQKSVTSDKSFDAEWTVVNDAGDRVTVMTPFHRLVLAARHATFKGEPLKPNEPDRVLKEQKDRLPLWVQLRGPREDFARHFTPRLLLDGGQRAIEPTFVQNERSAVRQGDRFVARCVYGFPLRDLTSTSRVVLVVRDVEQRDVSRFTIDLSAMR